VSIEPDLNALTTNSARLNKAASLAFGTPLPSLLSPPITTFDVALIVDDRVVDDVSERLPISHGRVTPNG